MIDLTGRLALVTGAARGIGRSCALRLAEAGADVIVNYVTSRAAADEVAQKIQTLGRRAAVVRADISEQDDIVSMLGFVKDSFGRLDILVSNAATGGFRPLMATTARQFEAAMNTNTRALLFLMQSALPLLRRKEGRAKVIALTSHGSRFALPLYGLIGSTKAALESLARHLALELGGEGINVNLVQAGLVDTDSMRSVPGSERLFDLRRSRSLTGDRILEAGDVADVVLFLASPLSDLIQGQTIVVDGGAAIRIGEGGL
jgi:enoyl-[acyl-carrier protein] reductase III